MPIPAAPSQAADGAPPDDGAGATLVIQTAFLGDVVLTTPLLEALARRYGAVDLVTTPAAAQLMDPHPAVREVIRFDKRGADRGWRGLRRLAKALQSRHYARAILPHRSWRSAALAAWAGVPVRIGFADSPAALLYTARVGRAASGQETARLAALAGPVVTGPLRPSLGLTEADRAEAASWLATRGMRPGFIALAPGSVWGTKRWPFYPELAERLAGPLVVLGGPDEVSLAQPIVARGPSRIFSAAGGLGIRAAAALLERAALIVTNDSAPLHLASAVGTPVVAIFGPTIPAFGFGPMAPDDVVVEHAGLSCRPCSTHGPMTCPLGHHRCMREVTVDAVRAAVERVLQRREAPDAIHPRH